MENSHHVPYHPPLHKSGALLSLAALSLALAACGGGGGGGSPGSNSTGSPVSTTLSGTFNDAPTQGLKYSAAPSGLTGTTDAAGHFSYQAGDTVSFSLALGGSNSLKLGSFSPVGSGGNAQLFVLGLPNGDTIAQVLQSLNHSTSADHLDVGSLSLNGANSADVATLQTLIDSDGSTLGGAASAQDLLSTVQGHISGTTFTQTGAVSPEDALTHALSSLATLAGENPLNALQAFKGQTLFLTGTSNTNPEGGFVYITEDGTYSNSSNGWTVAGNYANYSGSDSVAAGATKQQIAVGSTTYTFQGDASAGAYSIKNDYDLKGGGSYALVQDVGTDFVGKAITVTGWDICGADKPVTIAFRNSTDIYSREWTAYCETASKLKAGSSTVISSGGWNTVTLGTGDNAEIESGLLYMSGNCQPAMYAGVVGSGLQAGSQLAFVLPPTTASTIGTSKLLKITEVANVTDANLLKVFNGECANVATKPITSGPNMLQVVDPIEPTPESTARILSHVIWDNCTNVEQDGHTYNCVSSVTLTLKKNDTTVGSINASSNAPGSNSASGTYPIFEGLADGVYTLSVPADSGCYFIDFNDNPMFDEHGLVTSLTVPVETFDSEPDRISCNYYVPMQPV